jgi:hypothetical protein
VERLVEVRDRCDDLYPTVTRVSLLYGYVSKPNLHAQAVGSSFVTVKDEMAKGEQASDDVVESEMKEVAEHLIVFGEAAADQVRRGWLRRKLRPRLRGVPAVPADW